MRAILLASAAAFALSQAAAAQESVRNSTTLQLFAAISGNGNFSSQVIGLDVYNDNKQYIGQIEDIAMNQAGQTQAYILSVGGILGMGERYVAVNPSAVKVIPAPEQHESAYLLPGNAVDGGVVFGI
jgi:sporulation protein YlmC with PRC-barrel domain